ncbi:TPA: hypothetical protein ACQZB3_003145, partial [Escherichia coli]
NLKKDDYNKLSGYILYTKSIDPHFYTKLNRRFFKEIKFLENYHNKKKLRTPPINLRLYGGNERL